MNERYRNGPRSSAESVCLCLLFAPNPSINNHTSAPNILTAMVNHSNSPPTGASTKSIEANRSGDSYYILLQHGA